MKIEKLTNQNLKNNKLPSQAVVIQLLDKDQNHLAFVACQYEKVFPLYDLANDREESRFLEEISNFEAEILTAYFQTDGKTAKDSAVGQVNLSSPTKTAKSFTASVLLQNKRNSQLKQNNTWLCTKTA